MAIEFPNFLGVPIQKNDFSGIGDAISNYYAGKAMPKTDQILGVQAKYAEPNAAALLEDKKLKNIYQSIINQYEPATKEGAIESTRLGNIYNRIRNQFAPDTFKAQIDNQKSLAGWRNQNKAGGGTGTGMGGGPRGGGVTAQLQALLMNQIQQDNPNFTKQQAFEAAGNLTQGKEALLDGTPFNASGLTKLTAAKVLLGGTTSGLATQGVKAAQAEAEIPLADKYITEGRTPYGDTYMGHSPQQLSDMLNTKDEAAQTRLGKYAAADLLQLEKAALGLKMAGIESGVTIMDEAMKKADQTIKQSKYIQTDKSRQVAMDTYRNALNEMLKARKSVGVLESGLTGGGNKNKDSSKKSSPNEKVIDYAIVNGNLVRS